MSEADGAKLSFGFKKSSVSKKVNVNVAERDADVKEKILSIEGGVIKTDAVAATGAKVHVIPRIENTYRTGKGDHGKGGTGPGKFTPSFKPLSNDAPISGEGGDRFEQAAPQVSQITSYGLQLRGKDAEGAEPTGRAGLGGSITERLTAQQQDEKTYQRDVEALPEEASLEAYEDMPIEEFGKAMLRGMGWAEGMGVGRNKKVVEAIEYLKRPERLGLGAKPQAGLPTEADKKKQVKMGDKATTRREDMVLAPDADGRQRNIRKLDEKLVHRSEVEPGPRPGKAMAIVDGRHKGLACTVVSMLPKEGGRSDRCTVRFAVNEEVVEVRCKELGEVWEAKEASKRRKEESKKDRERDRDGSSGHDDDRDSAKRHRSASCPKYDNDHAGEAPSTSAPSGPPWLYPHIRVRVVDKQVGRGKLYLKKGTVVDVHPGALADVSMDDSRDVVQLKQSSLETVIPKTDGAGVLIVLGKLRGQRARILKSKSSSGAAAVQLVSDYSVHRLMLEEVCEFCGNMDEDA